jgi:UDP-2,4-diacetamido-2,4,6-trideoxy-beta-L-altropyranose hydrolase
MDHRDHRSDTTEQRTSDEVAPSAVLFRCDASPSIGVGHVMRCQALALALRAHSVDVAFLMRGSYTVDGFETFRAPDGDDTSRSSLDLERTLEIATRGDFETVVVDHYGASATDFEALKEAGLRVGVIDDLADRDLSAADWILNQNIGAHAVRYRARADALVLCGLRYALLRPEFAEARTQLASPLAADEAHLLITLGGGATADLCSSLLATLDHVEPSLSIRCVTTDANAQLRRAADQSRHTVEVLSAVDNMVGQMMWADVSINGGGTTCWELLCLGVPMVVLVLSYDQRLNAPALERAQVAVSADSIDGAQDALAMLLSHPVRMLRMSTRGMQLVDGRGAHRVAEALLRCPYAVGAKIHAPD